MRKLRFSLRGMLIAVTVAAVLTGWLGQPLIERSRQRAVLDEVVRRGAVANVRGWLAKERPTLAERILSSFVALVDCEPLYALDFTRATHDDLAALVNLRWVRELNLAGTAVSDAEMDWLAHLPWLSTVDLSGTAVTDEGLAKLRPLNRLVSVKTERTATTYAGLAELAEHLPLARPTEMRAIAELQAAGVQVVTGRRYLESLDPRLPIAGMQSADDQVHDVIVGMNRRLTLSAEDAFWLGQLASVPRVIFHTATLGPGGLTKMAPPPNVTELQFWNVNLTDADLAVVARCPKLEKLTLYKCPELTDAGLTPLGAASSLKFLRVDDCDQIRRATIERLQRELPGCEVEFQSYRRDD